MKLDKKYAIVCGSGVFTIISFTAFFNVFGGPDVMNDLLSGNAPPINSMKLLEILTWAAAGGFTAGVFGHFIGDIMGNPTGPKPEDVQKTRRQLAEEKVLQALEQARAEGAPTLESLDYDIPTAPQPDGP